MTQFEGVEREAKRLTPIWPIINTKLNHIGEIK